MEGLTGAAERAGRHVLPGVPATSRSRSRQDRHRRAAPDSRTSPGTWCSRRTRTRATYRGDVENGGFGAEAAAPAASKIIAHALQREGRKPAPEPVRREQDGCAAAGGCAPGAPDERLARRKRQGFPGHARRASRSSILRHRPAALPRGGRADRLQHLRRRQRHAGRHPRQSGLLPRSARRPTGRRDPVHGRARPGSTTRGCASGAGASTARCSG